MGLIPSEVRRFAIQVGDGPIVMPSSTRATKRPHRTGSKISTDNRSVASPPDSATSGDSRANGTPWQAAKSRATPATDMASGRLGLTSRSKSTSDRRPMASASGRPTSRLSSSRRMPSWSSPMAISVGEHNMPLDHSPRILRRTISMPSGMTVPSVARGTRSPTDMLKAPQQIWRASPSPASTWTSWMRSASGCGASSSTRATTMPSRPSPTTDMDSTARPRALSWSLMSAGSPSTGANSCSQESRTFMGGGRSSSGS